MYLKFTGPKSSDEPKRFIQKQPTMRFVMRTGLFYLFLLVFSMQLVRANSEGPTTLDSIQVTVGLQNENLQSLFKEIEAQTGLMFAYQPQQVAHYAAITLPTESRSVRQTLDMALEGTELKYRQVNNNVIIFSAEEQSRIIENETQSATVKGKVSDAGGNPMPGVNILEKGTSNGTTTDVDGFYSLEISESNVVLVFSFIGFVTQEVTVNGRSVIDVSLEEDIQKLGEVVVIGYGEQRKSEVTGAVANVTSEDFIQGNVGDAAQLIQGKVAGLTVVSPTGDPTKRSQILLRGNSTLATSTQPLILIDGVPGDLNTLAQEDIASIDVLKDGSAAAIYGTRGTNGVILITSKKNTGKIRPTLNYNSYVSTEEWVRAPRMLTAADYRKRIAAGDAFTDLGYDTDWVGEISNDFPVTQYHNLSLRGGNSETNYMGSVNYRQSPGMILNYDYSIFNTRFDLNHNMFDNKLRINVNFVGNENKRGVDFDQVGEGLTDSPSSAVFNQALWRNPTAPLKNENGTWHEQTSISYYENPLALLNETYGDYKSTSKRLTGSVTWEPVKNLSLKALASNVTDNNARSQGHTKRHLSTVRDGLQGYASVSSGQSSTKLLDLTADYMKEINQHSFRLLAGYSYQGSEWQSSSMRNWAFPAGNFSYPDNIGMGQRAGLGGPNLMSSAKYASNLIGFFGRFNYNFGEKYLFMASLRHEASSKFIGTDRPWGTFPAVSAGWRIHEEEFMKASGLFDQLKLRVGYGITGTAPDEYFLGVPLLGFQGSFLINGKWVPSLTPTRNPNPSLRWEEKRETNIGLDFAVLNQRVSGSIDYYNRTTDGLLYNYTVPTPPNAYRTTTANVGIMENKGLEVLLNFVPLQTAKFVWTSTANFSTNRNKLVSLSNDLYETTNPWFNAGNTGSPISTYTHRIEVGKDIGNFYGYKVIDVTDDGNWVYENKNGEPSATRAEEDKKYLGNGLPNYYAGWNNNIKYGNFDLSVTMRGAFDFQILNYQRMFYENPGRTIYNQLATADDPVFGKTRLNNSVPIEYNSYYVEHGDYWKIDNVKLGYDFHVSESKHIQKAYVYISTRNTFIITGYKGMDPEVNQLGLTPGADERNKYPSTRVYSLGVNFTIN